MEAASALGPWGAEVFIVNMRRLWSWEFRRMWPLFLEFCFSTARAFAYAISIVLFLLGLMIPMPDSLYVQHLFPPAFTGLILGVVCLLQFAVSLMIERRYEKTLAPRCSGLSGSRWCTGC